jgi:hypothetical protein
MSSLATQIILAPSPSGTPIRISDTPDWPPAIFFDAAYSTTVLHQFGAWTLKDELARTWKNAFYPDGFVN